MIRARPMNKADLQSLSEYWYDQIVLYQLAHRHIELLPDARSVWERFAAQQIESADTFALVCEIDAEIVGGLIGQIRYNRAGLAPERYGVVEYMLVDLHTVHRREQIANTLLTPFLTYLRERAIAAVSVDMLVNALVEQGFWRGLGARKVSEQFWMAL